MREEFLLPGDMVTSKGPAHFRTLLGSCVAVCLSNPKRGVFAMNHFMLPDNPGNDDVGRYGDTSTRRIIQTLMALDRDPSHLYARVYGGGAVVGHLGSAGGIGARNIELARKVLSSAGIRTVHEEVGGRDGRKLDFWTQEDRVVCQLIKDQACTTESRGAPVAKNALKVLVVDDSAVARAVIRQGVQRAGMNVIAEAANAFEARERIVRLNPDVVTLDLEMPMLDGISFLRQLTKYYPIPVVVVSSSAPSGSDRARQALEAGAQAVVDKADLDMSSHRNNVEKVLIPRIKFAALARLGRPR